MKITQTINNFLYEQEFYTNKRFVKLVAAIFNYLPNSTKIFTYSTTVTFSMTTEERNVSHSKFAELFGVVRELYGMEQIPNFKKEIGKKYMLKTRNASYQYLKDFHFGDEITIKMFVTNLTDISYQLIAGFYKENELRTIGTHKIIHTDMQGMPTKMDEGVRNMLDIVNIQLN